MNTLGLPDRFLPHVTALPEGDVQLTSDIRLRVRDAFSPNGHSQGIRYTGPKGLVVIATLDDTERFGVLLHVSLSYRDRDPEWTLIRAVRDAFYPNTADVMMVLPRAADYVNIQAHCFHLWETPSAWGIR